MLAIYTDKERKIKAENGELIVPFVPFEVGLPWFIRMSQFDRRLLLIDVYIHQIKNMTTQELVQSCRNRGLDEGGDGGELRARLLAGLKNEEATSAKTAKPKKTSEVSNEV